ncbi:hypothetical protein ACFY8S_09300 [Streptomyces hygroscopicus]|uniref:hypothetical protein n=1 Tax=Streptomyces hygroscopicus TaxID=1912 RepID=UPI00368EBC5B
MKDTKALTSLADLICRAQKQGRRTPMGIAMAIASARTLPPSEQSELERLRQLVDASPAELTEAQAEALAEAGNRFLNEENHEDLCFCDGWPEACVSGYTRSTWDSAAMEQALPAVIGLWESLRTESESRELRRLRVRVAELEEQIERRRMRLVKAETDLLEMRGLLSPNGRPRRIPPEVEIHERVAPAVEWLLARVAELEQCAAESRMSVVEDVANWLRSVGEDDAAYLVGTCDIPVGGSPKRVEGGADDPVPYVPTERAEAELLPAVVTSAALAAAEKLRRTLPLSGGERS